MSFNLYIAFILGPTKRIEIGNDLERNQQWIWRLSCIQIVLNEEGEMSKTLEYTLVLLKNT